MKDRFDVWDEENILFQQAYAAENYECIDTGVSSKLCYIFFSSNGLYYPDTEEVFRQQILEKNRYEWKWVAKEGGLYQKAGRLIYVRDLYKQWYSMGINRDINDIDKLIGFLRDLTQGYDVVTVGSSAGGYMAVLAACLLNAEFCFNFSGQYEVSPQKPNQYYDITELISECACTVFYFLPVYNSKDMIQYGKVKYLNNVKTFCYKEKNHAATMFAGNIPYIINRSMEEMISLYEQYQDKKIDKIFFLFHTVALWPAVKIFIRELKAFGSRRYQKVRETVKGKIWVKRRL